MKLKALILTVIITFSSMVNAPSAHACLMQWDGLNDLSPLDTVVIIAALPFLILVGALN